MTFQEYLSYTNRILAGEIEIAPYDNPDYFEYTKLNLTRMKRWLKTAELTDQTIKAVKSIVNRQHWIVISEPWCGDAAHILPFLHLMAKENKKIALKIELRDSEPFRIEKYLTNGKSKSIPILIVKTKEHEDLFVWGPRPKGAEEVRSNLTNGNATFEEMKTGLQKWYNDDKGLEIQTEIIGMLQAALVKK
jgi:hypothetical protein